MRRYYPIRLIINERNINTVIIDPHYEKKHSDTVNDEIILALVQSLNGGIFLPDTIDKEGYKYFATGPHYFKGKPFKLIWLLPPKGNYIGIINSYRRKYGKI